MIDKKYPAGIPAKVMYTNKAGKSELREVIPIDLRYYGTPPLTGAGRGWFLHTFDLGVQAYRSFHIDRIAPPTY